MKIDRPNSYPECENCPTLRGEVGRVMLAPQVASGRIELSNIRVTCTRNDDYSDAVAVLVEGNEEVDQALRNLYMHRDTLRCPGLAAERERNRLQARAAGLHFD